MIPDYAPLATGGLNHPSYASLSGPISLCWVPLRSVEHRYWVIFLRHQELEVDGRRDHSFVGPDLHLVLKLSSLDCQSCGDQSGHVGAQIMFHCQQTRKEARVELTDFHFEGWHRTQGVQHPPKRLARW